MKRKDWLCPACPDVMLKTGDYFMTCHAVFHSRLRNLWGIRDLPRATFFDYKRFRIRGEDGYWEYVPHAHKGCMNRAPEPHTIVARVERRHGGRRWYQAMTFRPAKAPRNKK